MIFFCKGAEVTYLEGVQGSQEGAGRKSDRISTVRIHSEQRHLELFQIDLAGAVLVAHAEVPKGL